MLSPTLLTSENDAALLVQDEPLYEIVDGQRVDLPPMSVYTTWLASRLQSRLGSYVEEHGLGTCVMEMLFILDTERNLRRRPDVAFVSADRWPLDREIPTTGDWDIVPDLAVEVISPNEILMELRENVLKYVIGTDHLYSEVRHNVPVTSCRYLPVQRPAVSRHKRHVRPTA